LVLDAIDDDEGAGGEPVAEGVAVMLELGVGALLEDTEVDALAGGDGVPDADTEAAGPNDEPEVASTEGLPLVVADASADAEAAGGESLADGVTVMLVLGKALSDTLALGVGDREGVGVTDITGEAKMLWEAVLLADGVTLPLADALADTDGDLAGDRLATALGDMLPVPDAETLALAVWASDEVPDAVTLGIMLVVADTVPLTESDGEAKPVTDAEALGEGVGPADRETEGEAVLDAEADAESEGDADAEGLGAAEAAGSGAGCCKQVKLPAACRCEYSQGGAPLLA